MNLISVNLLIETSKTSGAAELSNAQLFIFRLCEALDLPPPDFARERDCENHYVFEKIVSFGSLNGRPRNGRIDLYKRGCFVLESKQSALARRQHPDHRQPGRQFGPGAQSEPGVLPGSRVQSESGEMEGSASAAPTRKPGAVRRGTSAVRRGTSAWRRAMTAARMQAEHYARALPAPPPFLIILDVGNVMEIYADFSGGGSSYAPFPDPARHRIAMDDLRDPEIQQRLRALWMDPESLAGEMNPPCGRGEDALTSYLLDRAASRRRNQPLAAPGVAALIRISGGRIAPCLGVRERGSMCRILV